MRYRFEQWARENIGQFSDAGHWGTGGKWVYTHNFVQMCWLCWQAACSTIDAENSGDEKHG
jgi:hypothetical protein